MFESQMFTVNQKTLYRSREKSMEKENKERRKHVCDGG